MCISVGEIFIVFVRFGKDLVMNFLLAFGWNYSLYLFKFKCYLLKSLAIGFIIINLHNLQQFKRTLLMIVIDQIKRSLGTRSIKHLKLNFIYMIHIAIGYILTSLQRITRNFDILNPFDFSLLFDKLYSYIAVYFSFFQDFDFNSKHFRDSFE